MISHEFEIKVDGVTTTKILMVDGTIAPTANQTVGCVDIKYKGRRSATIRQLFVRPAYRNRGIGTMIMARCLELARAEGCEALSFCVAKDNKPAWHFYIKRGFSLAWQEDDGGLVMTKNLREPPPAEKSDDGPTIGPNTIG